MAVAYLDVRGGRGGKGSRVVFGVEELSPAVADAVTVEVTGSGFSLPNDDSLLLSLSLSLSLSDFVLCKAFPSESF